MQCNKEAKMKLTVESKDGQVEVFYDSDVCKDAALVDIPGTHCVIQRIVIKHSDIDTLTETLKLYKERMSEVMGVGVLK